MSKSEAQNLAMTIHGHNKMCDRMSSFYHAAADHKFLVANHDHLIVDEFSYEEDCDG